MAAMLINSHGHININNLIQQSINLLSQTIYMMYIALFGFISLPVIFLLSYFIWIVFPLFFMPFFFSPFFVYFVFVVCLRVNEEVNTSSI